MREIKFRAWDKLDRVMLQDLPIIDFDICRINGLTLLQYTGLKDKNDKEIYEGDIIQWWNKTTKPQIVETTNGGWNPFIDDCVTDHPYHYEVIGNIYENPELLKEG